MLDTDIYFPNDELGEISRNIVHLYKRMQETKDEVNNEREKQWEQDLLRQIRNPHGFKVHGKD